MIFVLSERRIVKRIHDARWYVPDSAVDPKLGFVSNIYDHQRWSSGMKKEDIMNIILREDARQGGIRGFLCWLHAKIFPKYLRTFSYKFNHFFQVSLDKGYVKQVGDRYAATWQGEEIASWFYYPKLFYESKLMQQLLTALIQFGIPLLAAWIAIHLFNITIGAK